MYLDGELVEIKDDARQEAGRISGVKVVAEQLDSQGVKLCKELSEKAFWCYDNHKHENNENYMDDHCCITHTVGLPIHPATKQPMPLTPYQIEFFEEIQKIVQFTPENQKQFKIKEEIDWLRKCHLFHINKGRQMGFTEIVLRVIQYFCFSRYAGKNIAIQAGTTGKLADKDLRRFARLFKNIPLVVEQWVKSKTFKIINNTTIESFSANEEAMTGDTFYACVFQDESAKWRLVDDKPVFNSIMPIVRSNGADLYLVSTPKGTIKMFYKIHKEPDDFHKFVYNIWRTEGNLYTTQDIEEKLATKTEDPNQEYLCQFTMGEDSIFGTITDEDRETGWEGFSYSGDEDDSYVENDDDHDEIHEPEDEDLKDLKSIFGDKNW